MSAQAVERVESTTVYPGTVYVLFDESDRVLYVGMTLGDPADRLAQHAADKPWWPQVARSELHHYSTQFMTRRAESAYIELLKPIHNVVRPFAMCQVCGYDRVHAHGRCAPCWMYFKNHGEERPQHLIDRKRARKEEDAVSPTFAPIRVVSGGSFANRHQKDVYHRGKRA